ncbi:MAG TPA: hypothetical protein VGN17_04855 [Bryobacteraceae bacterium]|jgi:hypothetical protein
MTVRNGLLVWPHAKFSDGRLVVADGTWLEVIRPWTQPGARRWEHGKGWRPFVPTWFHLGTMQREIDRIHALPFPSMAKQERADAFARTLAIIPDVVRALVARFPSNHLRFVWAAARGGAYFLQLLEDHPVLALLIAERRRFGIRTPVRDLVERKRHHVLGLFGFPSTPRCARVLQRLPPSALTVRLLRALSSACHQESVIDALADLPRITRPGLALLMDPLVRAWLTPDCLIDAASALTLPDVQDLHERLTHFATEPPIPLRSVAALHWFLAYTDDCAARRITLSTTTLLAPPLVPGIETPELRIMPLRTTGELLRETLLLQHCAITHEQEARLGKRFFYAIHAPGLRATLSIKRTKKGLVISDLRGRNNKRVPNHIWKAMREWMATTTDDRSSDWTSPRRSRIVVP